MPRILAIDYGAKRTGIAVSDPEQIIAGGLTTVDTAGLWAFLENYIRGEAVERIVIGMPVQNNGSASENQKNIRPFISRWKKLHPEIPICEYDERFTSVMAHRTMLASGLKKMARRNKALADEISATIILQGWMESRRNLRA